MAKTKKTPRPKARLPKGLRDIPGGEIRARDAMLGTIRKVYERYGFEPLDTPAFEYTDALGKFLPDQDRPNAGVFSFQDEDEQWLSLRYDLTAPLARHVAENYETLPKPFRRYQVGSVWRNEKPGPGRFREFIQFDADTVGASTVAADAEMCMLAADALEALGLKGKYVIKVNNRKVLDGVLESICINPYDEADAGKCLTILRALDKYDRLGLEGVQLLLGTGRRDESGDFTKGAELADEQILRLRLYLTTRYRGGSLEVSADAKRRGEVSPVQNYPGEDTFPDDAFSFSAWRDVVDNSSTGLEGVDELERISELCRASDYGPGRIYFDASVVRGLEYYTGPVYEAELTFKIEDEKSRPIRFGSVGGGGRYDGLVARFKGQPIPATGFSIGVSRLATALATLGKLKDTASPGPVVVAVFDKKSIADYQGLVTKLRNADIRAELYLGNGNLGKQFKYADQRGSPCVVIQGDEEKEKGEVQIKDLIEGAKAAQSIASNEEWRAERPAQFAVREDELVEAVRELIKRHES